MEGAAKNTMQEKYLQKQVTIKKLEHLTRQMFDRILSSLMLCFLSSSSKSMTDFFSGKPCLQIK